MSRPCLKTEGPAIPLARWAGRQLRQLAAETGSTEIAALDGLTLLGERGSHNGYRISGHVSAGNGGSRLMPTADDRWFALTLIRDEDRELLPALFLDAGIDGHDPIAIEQAVLRFPATQLVGRGRLLGLPCASTDETPVSTPIEVMKQGAIRQRPADHRPLVIDLSAIWAGPLAGHLLWLAGAQVVRVESKSRPDLLRQDDPVTFGLLNQGKASAMIDLTDASAKGELIELIRRADIVLESSRPRALMQLGIDATALVQEVPGLVWLTITGHGASGEAADWVGLGNDCGVAAGLARAMEQAGGEIGFVGDAITDPLTGITAALVGWRALQSGQAQRIGFSMSAIAARALADERVRDRALIDVELHGWSQANGSRFPNVARRAMLAPVREPGADTSRYFTECLPC